MSEDYIALDWVKEAIDETLKQAQRSLEDFVESPTADELHLASCADYIHQVHGTLLMMEFYGAALLAEEMESIIKALSEGKVSSQQDSLEVLMQAIIQLPYYLDHVKVSRRDLPVVLLPMLNELRSVRGAPFLSETSLFNPTITHNPSLDKDRKAQLKAEKLIPWVKKNRQLLQVVTLQIFQNRDLDQAKAYLKKIFLRLNKSLGATPQGIAWLPALAFSEWLAQQKSVPKSAKVLLRQLDQLLKQIVDQAAEALDQPASNELLKNLLFYVAETEAKGQAIALVRKRFDLEGAILKETQDMGQEELASGSTTDAFASAIQVLLEEITLLEEDLDLISRDLGLKEERLPSMLAQAQRVADTLGVLGLGAARTDIIELHDSLSGLAGRTDLTPESFVSIADALLVIETSLKSAAENGRYTDQTNEISNTKSVLIQESRNTLKEIKEAILLYVGQGQDPSHLAGLPGLLHTVEGSVQMVPLDRLATVLSGLVRFLSENSAPDIHSVETFADVLAAADYYLEHYELRSVDSDGLLDTMESGLESLFPADLESELIFQLDDDSDEHVTELNEQEETEQVDPASEEAASQSDSNHDDEMIDDDIIEVFLEESEEVQATLNESWPAYKANSENNEALVVTRRAFHTLKGSGRMVGATQMGELSWAIENMLNRLLDGQIAQSDELMQLVEQVIHRLPELTDSYRNKESLDPAPLDAIRERANKIAEGVIPGSPVEIIEDVPVEGIDPDRLALFEIFIGEASLHVETIIGFVQKSREEYFANTVSEEPRRALHTLKGGGYTAGLNPIAEMAAPLEQLVIKIREHNIDNSAELADLLDAAATSISAVLTPDALAHLENMPDEEVIFEKIALLEQSLADQLIQQNTSLEEENLAAILSVDMDAVLDAEELLNQWFNDSRVESFTELEVDLKRVAQIAEEVGVKPISHLSQCLADFYAAHVQAGTQAQEDIFKLAQEAQEELLGMMDCIASGLDIPAVDELLDRIQAHTPEVTLEKEDLVEPEPVESEAIEPSEHVDIQADLESPDTENPDADTFSETNEYQKALTDSLNALGVLLYEWRSAPNNLSLVADLAAELKQLEQNSAMAAVASVQQLCADMQRLCEHVQENNLDDTTAAFEVFSLGHDELARQLLQYSQGEVLTPAITITQAIETILSGETNATQAEQPLADTQLSDLEAGTDSHLENFHFDESDREIIEIFLEEADELMEEFDESVESWKKDTHSREPVDEKLRILHTLKGGARLAGLLDIGETAHNLEADLQKVIDNNMQAGSQFFVYLSDKQEQLHQQIDAVSRALHANGVTPAAIDNTAVDSSKKTEGELVEDDSQTSNVVSPFPSLTINVQNEPPASASVNQAEVDASSQRKAPTDMVKVSADLLDNLVNLAGETAIGRSRFEQQVNDYSSTLVEMDQTLERLNDQLRRLDLETEAQIQYGHERQGPDYDDFDPLEMDRYSTMQQLSRALMESKSDLVDLRDTLKDKTTDAEAVLLQQGRVNTELQQGLMQTRMVPFQSMVPRLRRIVRQVSLELDKQVDFQVQNAEGEMDRAILERMITPLEHMLRNALDHGIESEQERLALGKSAVGLLKLNIQRDAGDMLVSLQDDGRGINLTSVLDKARRLGMVADDAQLSDQEIIQFILQPGFTTLDKATQISGRGIGMDVIGSEIKEMGGTVAIESAQGVGTNIQVRLPFTVSVNRALMIRMGTDLYAIPLNDIEGIVRTSLTELNELYAQPLEERTYQYAGTDYRLNYLGSMLDHRTIPSLVAQTTSVPLILIRGSEPFALQVDSLLGSREVVVKNLGPQFNSVSTVSGGTILGDGSVAMILDIPSMIRAQKLLGNDQTIMISSTSEQQPEEKKQTQVLVVDDSVTVRKVTTRLLERNGFEVETAKDGVHALEVLQGYRPDIILLDIEMPHMDGFEFASRVRFDSQLKNIPIIMITSRTGDKHRERAMSLGVNQYLGKPFQEDNLLSEISQLVGTTAGH